MKSTSTDVQAVVEVPSGEPGAAGGPHVHGIMDVSWPLMVWTWVAFAALLVILQRVAWRPILRGLDQREQRIRGALDDADKARTAADAARVERDRVVAEAQAQAKAILDNARTAAQAAAQAAEARARAAGDALLADARREIEAATEHARGELRRASATLAIGLAGRLTETNLDTERNRALTQKWLQDA